MTSNKKTRFSLIVFILTLIFFYLPLFILLMYSFNSGKSMNWEGFSFRWYQELFLYSPDLWQAFLHSIVIALSSAFLATLIGTLGAIALYWYQFGWKKYLEISTYLPLILPEIIIGISLLILFTTLHFNLSLFTIFLAHTTFNIPFTLLILLARLEEFDYTIIEAARDLGATELQTLRKVIVPVLMPGILAGFLIAMTLSLDDFVITFFVTGPGSSTLPLHIYSMIRFGVSPVINALSMILVGFTLVLALSTQRLNKYMIK
jgi:spermidine/putrescine transport system permease protein